VHSPAEHAAALRLRCPIGIAATAENQTFASSAPGANDTPPIGEISEISGFLFSSTTTISTSDFP
jgi:hypothetical protein